MLDPIDQRAERNDRDRPDATAAMADAGRAEQAIEALQLLEVRLVAVAVARRHLAIIVDDAARIDQLIVAADESEQLAAMLLELVERSEGIGDVGDVARAVLRHLRVARFGDAVPIERGVVLVPMELRAAEREQ